MKNFLKILFLACVFLRVLVRCGAYLKKVEKCSVLKARSANLLNIEASLGILGERGVAL
ncbi:MAG: hypothetical protein LBH37_02215 [Oscillospiraceae bacterium]|nr:hypothetical protein [Oscillospiraceae bacterium]